MFSFGIGPDGDHMYPFYLIIRNQQPLLFKAFLFVVEPVLIT